MSKYMASLDQCHHLTNVIQYLNQDMESLPQWEQDFISDIKASVQHCIKDHFESSAATRQKFASVAPALWKEPETGLFRLVETPRPVLGYLPPKVLQSLDHLCQVPMDADIQDARKELTHLFTSMRASQSDRDEVRTLVSRDSNLLRDVEDHHQAVEHWTSIKQKKVAILRELEAREVFLDEVEDFERTTSGDKTRFHSRNSLALAHEARYRAQAAKKLVQLDQRAVELCTQYNHDTGKHFEVDGVSYLDMINEQRVGRSSLLSLSLAKLRPQAMVASTIPKPGRNTGSTDPPRRKSLHELGASANGLIRKGKDSILPPTH